MIVNFRHKVACQQVTSLERWRQTSPNVESRISDMWTPNNKTIITLEPIEIPFSFMLRCWSIWRGILTRNKSGSVWLGGGGPRSKGAPNYNFLNDCFGVILLYAIRKISLLRAFWYQDHTNRTTTTCDMATGPLWVNRGRPNLGGPKMGPQVWKLTHNVLLWIQTLAQKEWNLRRCVKISLKNVYTWHGMPLM